MKTLTFKKIIQVTVIGVLIGGVGVMSYGAWVLKNMYDHLPELDVVKDYQPKIPLRIWTKEGDLIGEFGEEKRDFVAFKDTPEIMKQALLAAEDDRFYEHGGVDWLGVARALWTNVQTGSKQGASTITQQVARNFFLTREQTLARKVNEALLSYKIEQSLSKDQVFELYLNQIFLGHKAYGFAAASRVYWGKSLNQISVAEAAMLAGLPKAPSTFNPVNNPKRAKARQEYVLKRMRHLNFISEETYQQALKEPLKLAIGVKKEKPVWTIHGEYVAEMARQWAVETWKEQAYTKGINIITTMESSSQKVADEAVKAAILNYDKQHGYRGPEGTVEWIAQGRATKTEEDRLERARALQSVFQGLGQDVLPIGVVLERQEEGFRVQLKNKEILLKNDQINGWGVGVKERLKRGDVIRLQDKEGQWVLSQWPEVSAATVEMDPETGAILSWVGGFDFNSKPFNRISQAYRQAGSSFKPFVYSAALEKGVSPATLINDGPFSYDPGQGEPLWTPKNYDGKMEGLMTMRRALTLSKNLVSVRLIQHISPAFAKEHALKFGFEDKTLPAYLPLALGAGSVTPLQLAVGYGVFANGGYRVEPYFIEKVTLSNGQVIMTKTIERLSDERRVISEGNRFIMHSLLKDVVLKGTAARAAVELKRHDLAGKTGTTNDAHDAWFAGYHPQRVAVVWMGFDQPKSLGDKETGGGLALPIWIQLMKQALKDKPEESGSKKEKPESVIEEGGEWYLKKFPPGTALKVLGGEKKESTIKDEEDLLKMDESMLEKKTLIIEMER